MELRRGTLCQSWEPGCQSLSHNEDGHVGTPEFLKALSGQKET